jgi:hypothetical protein
MLLIIPPPSSLPPNVRGGAGVLLLLVLGMLVVFGFLNLFGFEYLSVTNVRGSAQGNRISTGPTSRGRANGCEKVRIQDLELSSTRPRPRRRTEGKLTFADARPAE